LMIYLLCIPIHKVGIKEDSKIQKIAHPGDTHNKSNKTGKTRKITVNVSEEWSAGAEFGTDKVSFGSKCHEYSLPRCKLSKSTMSFSWIGSSLPFISKELLLYTIPPSIRIS